MPLAVKDKIEINVDTIWVPATVDKIFPDRELGFFTAELANATRIQIMINNEDRWRYPSAALSA